VKPGPYCPFVIATRLAALALVVLAWRAGWPWGLTLGTFGLLGLGRVPRRKLLIELAVGLAILGLAHGFAADVIDRLPLGAAAVALAALLLAPESGLVRLNGIDRFFVMQDSDDTPTNCHARLDLSAPLDRQALEQAAWDLHVEVPILRSFIREAAFGVQRFVARRPFATRLVRWQDRPLADEDPVLYERFDAGREPPFRFYHAPDGAGGASLFFTWTHGTGDGEGGILALDWLLRRYNDYVKGRPKEPFPRTQEGLRLRDVVRARGKGYGWMWRMARRHLKPAGKVGQRNAELYDDVNATGGSFRNHTSWITPETFESLNQATDSGALTRNDLLVTAALRAADRLRLASGREDRPFRLTISANLRRQLGLEPAMQNFLGTLQPLFTVDEVRSRDLAKVVHERIQHGRELEDIVETPIHLGIMTLLLPPWLMRKALRKLETATDGPYFSFLYSSYRQPEIRAPEGTQIRNSKVLHAMPRRPPIALSLGRDRGAMRIMVIYRHPMVSDATAQAFAQGFRAEVDRIVASAGSPAQAVAP